MSKPASPIVIYGPAASSYVWATRMTCSEKGAEHELRPIKLRSDEHRDMHPFCKVPVLEHEGRRLFESQACMTYLNDLLPGPDLMPSSPVERGYVMQWISLFNCYLYGDIVVSYVLEYVFPDGPTPDRAAIDAAAPKMREGLGLLDQAYRGRTWIGGDSISLADILLAPALFYAKQFPEGAEAIAELSNLSRATNALLARPSFLANAPAPPPQS